MNPNKHCWPAGSFVTGNGSFPFTGAIHEEIVFLRPFGNGFAEKGFACVGEL